MAQLRNDRQRFARWLDFSQRSEDYVSRNGKATLHILQCSDIHHEVNTKAKRNDHIVADYKLPGEKSCLLAHSRYDCLTKRATDVVSDYHHES
uniref:Metallophos domain-containing protein n=1 Tax=Mesocestoides corti TaxID=53468 RepID=A0A5K3G4K7_MESCO